MYFVTATPQSIATIRQRCKNATILLARPEGTLRGYLGFGSTL